VLQVGTATPQEGVPQALSVHDGVPQEGLRHAGAPHGSMGVPHPPTRAGVAGARVHLRDAVGTSLTLESNAAGNFYTDAPLVFPLRASVEFAGLVHEMEPDVTYGGCNACHRLPPRQDAPGRVTIPTADGEGD